MFLQLDVGRTIDNPEDKSTESLTWNLKDCRLHNVTVNDFLRWAHLWLLLNFVNTLPLLIQVVEWLGRGRMTNWKYDSAGSVRSSWRESSLFFLICSFLPFNKTLSSVFTQILNLDCAFQSLCRSRNKVLWSYALTKHVHGILKVLHFKVPALQNSLISYLFFLFPQIFL